ncbi:hypothetical protein [Chengkuizengella axinellae]|uniref:Uncharacterized protein n=1 Tax=Chengkuizengella axinellae TaxID=3064388 RepID=A0ABT9J285_9BACL|nr:hypothetical protein [Chengkuizengella sp. 2205SS18-9]MDP5275722.1 hypothetical protein [Chengkuizengella sp. 2205SS18-9]
MSDDINSKDLLLGILIGGVLGAIAVKYLGDTGKVQSSSSVSTSREKGNSEDEPAEGFANNVNVSGKAVATKFNSPQVFPFTTQAQNMNDDIDVNTTPVIKAEPSIEEKPIPVIKAEPSIEEKPIPVIKAEPSIEEKPIPVIKAEPSPEEEPIPVNVKPITDVKEETNSGLNEIDFIEKLELSNDLRTKDKNNNKKSKKKSKKNKS